MEPTRSHAAVVGVLMALRGRRLTCKQIAESVNERRLDTIRKMVRKLARVGLLRIAGTAPAVSGTRPFLYECVNLAPTDKP